MVAIARRSRRRLVGSHDMRSRKRDAEMDTKQLRSVKFGLMYGASTSKLPGIAKAQLGTVFDIRRPRSKKRRIQKKWAKKVHAKWESIDTIREYRKMVDFARAYMQQVVPTLDDLTSTMTKLEYSKMYETFGRLSSRRSNLGVTERTPCKPEMIRGTRTGRIVIAGSTGVHESLIDYMQRYKFREPVPKEDIPRVDKEK